MLMALGSLVLLTLLLGCLAVEAFPTLRFKSLQLRRDRELFCPLDTCTITFGQGAELYFSGIV